MRVACTLLVLVLASCARSEPPRQRDAGEDGGAVVVVPGHRIGPIQVGMDRGALSRLHLPMELVDGSTRVVRAGPYDVVFDPTGRIARVAIPMDRAPDGLRLLDTPVAPGASLDRMISVAPGCTPPVPLDGVPTLRCAGGGLLVQELQGRLVVAVARELDAGNGPPR